LTSKIRKLLKTKGRKLLKTKGKKFEIAVPIRSNL